MVSNRSLILTMWEENLPGGGKLYLQTSTGNQALEQQYAKTIGKDVISACDIVYMKVKETGDGKGCYIVFIVQIDVAGSLPDFIKQKIGEEQAKGLDKIIAYVKANYKK